MSVVYWKCSNVWNTWLLIMMPLEISFIHLIIPFSSPSPFCLHLLLRLFLLVGNFFFFKFWGFRFEESGQQPHILFFFLYAHLFEHILDLLLFSLPQLLLEMNDLFVDNSRLVIGWKRSTREVLPSYRFLCKSGKLFSLPPPPPPSTDVGQWLLLPEDKPSSGLASIRTANLIKARFG